MFAISDIKQWIRKTAPDLYNSYIKHQRTSFPKKVSEVLSDFRNPIVLSEKEFDILQGQYNQWWPQYDFDAYSTGIRAYQRAISFLKLESLRLPGKDVLEVACGDGMSGTALSIYGHQVTLLDYQDWRDNRARDLNFIQADLGKPLAIPNSSYDFIFSFNAFEHIPDPSLAIDEMIRVLRPGGVIWIDFNPLYASPLGLHAFCFKMPYPQYLFSDELIHSKIKVLGLNDLGQEMEDLQPLNHWRPQQFREIWQRNDCNIIEYNEDVDLKHIDIILKYPQAFRGRGLCLDDLTISGMHVVLLKH
jgi:ubiquinone/menaquinone biosynthesis C-methylase UbiE